MFSATWEKDSLLQLAREACSCRPIHINVGSTNLAACKDVKQVFMIVGHDHSSVLESHKQITKTELLIRTLKVLLRSASSDSKMLVFCNRCDTVPNVVKELR